MIQPLVQELLHFLCFRFWPPGGQEESDRTEILSVRSGDLGVQHVRAKKKHSVTAPSQESIDEKIVAAACLVCSQGGLKFGSVQTQYIPDTKGLKGVPGRSTEC
jgi:hypothetical protein